MSHKVTGCMFAYDAAIAVPIDVINQYHAVVGLAQDGCNEGVTFQASSTGIIAGTGNNGGVLRCTDVAHGLSTGEYAALTGMGDALHVGLTRVTYITDDIFDCDNIAYNSSGDVGNWTRPASLKIDQGHGGIFSVQYTISMLSAGVNRNYKTEFMRNHEEVNTIVAEQKISTASDLISLSAGGLVVLPSNAVLWVVVKNTSNDSDLELRQMNVHVHRL